MSEIAPAFLFLGCILLHSAFIISASWIAEPVVDDLSPTVAALKTISYKKNKEHCAIECVRTKSCASFSFGSNECLLWDTKYIVEDIIWKAIDYDNILKTKTGYTYYHLSELPKPTELMMSNIQKTFEEASASCQKFYRGNLVSIHDNKTMERIKNMLIPISTGFSVWIGLNGTTDVSGPKNSQGAFRHFNFRWADGNACTDGRSVRMSGTEPNQPGTACTALYKSPAPNVDFQLADGDCRGMNYYICQFALTA